MGRSSIFRPLVIFLIGVGIIAVSVFGFRVINHHWPWQTARSSYNYPNKPFTLSPPTSSSSFPSPRMNPPQTIHALSTIPIGFPVWTSSMASYFNNLRSTDIAAIFQDNSPVIVPSLSTITNGEATASYTSWADGQAALSTLPSSVKWILYDPEEWNLTPKSEQSNLVATAANASAAIHASGRKFFIAPSAYYSTLYAAQIAPYADRYDIQAEKYQTDTGQFVSFAVNLAKTIKSANPKCEVWIEVSVYKYAPFVSYNALRALPSAPDGVAIYASWDPQDLTSLQRLVTFLRSNG